MTVVTQLLTATGYLLTRNSDDLRDSHPPVADLSAIRQLLGRRAQAVAAHDREAFTATAASASRTAQGQLFDNLAKLPLSEWRETLASDEPADTGEEGWTGRIRVSYRLRGYDRETVTRTAYLTFGRPATRWLITGAPGNSTGLRDDPELWTGGPIRVVRGRHSLVIGAGRHTEQISARLEAAIPVASRMASAHPGRARWNRRVVAVLPASQQDAERMAGPGRSLQQIAALATGRPERIIVSPHLYPTLNRLGRRVVLTHELTHIATKAASDATTPMWLVEGLADYAGYKGTHISARKAARELAAEVKSGRLPRGLPARGDFTASTGRLAQSYEAAWLACRLVASRYGEGTLLRLYREAGRPGATEDGTLRAVLGTGVREFTAQWRAYLRKELG